MTQNRTHLIPWTVFCLTVFLDQGSKILVQSSLNLMESIPVVGTVVRFTYIRNPRGAFGLPLGGNIVFVIISVLAILVVLYYLWTVSKERVWSRGALSMILGGAVGNLIDRFRCGEVVDFIDIGIGQTRWPIFNIADSGVTVGVVLLFYALFLKKET